MIKRIIISLFLVLAIIPTFVRASSVPVVKIGNMYYETLEEAIANASSTDIIMLISDVVLDDTLLIDKVVNLNLNGNDISAPSMVFQVQGGTLNISGKGTIRELEPNYGAIMIKGSSNSSDTYYSVVNVGRDITLEGWSGIFISHESSKSYGVVVNFDGKINAINDISGGRGIGIYVNGNIKHQNNPPIVNILDNAEIISNGNGIYIAGNSVFNIGKSYISGEESGIGIKAGILNIDGATIICNGKNNTPTEGYNNGINASGTAIQIESNNGYAGNIKLNIKNGNFKSKNSNVIYEYIGKGNNTLVDSINISGGTFVSEASKDVFLFSNSFKQKHNSFVNGGKYSSNPSSYLSNGYISIADGELFSVVESTMKEVNSDNFNITGSNLGKGIIIFISVIVLIFLAYLNRGKILNLFKK